MAKPAYGILIVAAFAATALAGCTSPPGYETLTPAAFQTGLQGPGAFLLDVRTYGEYAAGHLPNATLLPHDAILENQHLLPQDKTTPMYLYCRSGQRSAIAADLLVDLGYTEVYDLSDGIRSWLGAGYPTTRSG